MYPAGLPGVTASYVTLPDGVTLRVLQSGPRDRDEAVVLLHGWAASVYTFAELLPALTRAGHRVVAIDLPGFGLSDKPESPGVYATRYMSDAVRVVLTDIGVRRYSIVAHSMGGAIALDLAVRGASGLSRMVLANPVGLGRAPIVAPLRLLSPRFMDRLAPMLVTRTLVRLVLGVAFATPGRPSARDVEEYWAPSQFDGYARACRACLRHADWRRLPPDVLAKLTLPVLVIVGEHDRLIRGAASHARHLPSARIVEVPDGGHIVIQECADRANDEITRFLAEP